ncbi:hypothetical protein PR048_014589 [Dryococelus australis]|uniref:Uncharacterized protein n=1 Tax=Dryococelus australis TaxID=614101 RepID=A0ABQ9HEV6_9NEOP|nr:hypothetical protein PR048_014589 [Dryococelus australis]
MHPHVVKTYRPWNADDDHVIAYLTRVWEVMCSSQIDCDGRNFTHVLRTESAIDPLERAGSGRRAQQRPRGSDLQATCEPWGGGGVAAHQINPVCSGGGRTQISVVSPTALSALPGLLCSSSRPFFFRGVSMATIATMAPDNPAQLRVHAPILLIPDLRRIGLALRRIPILQPNLFHITISRGAAVAERMACSPPNKANRIQSSSGLLPDLRKWESCRAEFTRGSPVSPTFAFRRCSGFCVTIGAKRVCLEFGHDFPNILYRVCAPGGGGKKESESLRKILVSSQDGATGNRKRMYNYLVSDKETSSN